MQANGHCSLESNSSGKVTATIPSVLLISCQPVLLQILSKINRNTFLYSMKCMRQRLAYSRLQSWAPELKKVSAPESAALSLDTFPGTSSTAKEQTPLLVNAIISGREEEWLCLFPSLDWTPGLVLWRWMVFLVAVICKDLDLDLMRMMMMTAMTSRRQPALTPTIIEMLLVDVDPELEAAKEHRESSDCYTWCQPVW